MRRLGVGEPRRKVCRVEEEQMPEDSKSQRGNSPPWPPPGAEGPHVTKLTSPITHNGNKRQAARIRKEENRSKRELKAKMRKEKATLKEKKRKEQEDTQRKKGERRTKNQPSGSGGRKEDSEKPTREERKESGKGVMTRRRGEEGTGDHRKDRNRQSQHECERRVYIEISLIGIM